jgi:hypothetical protein
MKHSLAALAFAALAACTPPQAAAPAASSSAAAAVQAIYAQAQQSIGHAVTPISAIPMTDDLKSLVERAEAAAAARQEPFIEGDLALNCQDCTSVSDLVIGPQTGIEQEPAIPGHTWVQAKFKLNGNEDRTILWDMIETAQGWRVDNILTEGFNLRTESQSYLADPAPAQAP